VPSRPPDRARRSAPPGPGFQQPALAQWVATTTAQVARADAEVRRYTAVPDGMDLYERAKHMRGTPGAEGPPSAPAQLRPAPSGVSSLPTVVVERSQRAANEGKSCFTGLLPDIRHAWASVDTSLFLWRYDVRGSVPIEYAAEQRPIT